MLEVITFYWDACLYMTNQWLADVFEYVYTRPYSVDICQLLQYLFSCNSVLSRVQYFSYLWITMELHVS
jgi:uncharacterized membrane protein YwaF